MGTEAEIPADCPLRGRFEVIAQESLLAGQPEHYDWPELDERSASSLCYTSGTTGDPKGVLYSHRSTVIHGLAVLQKDVFNIGAEDVVLPVVPMFHVNAWGIPYAAAMAGASLVLPGARLDPASLHRLFEAERVTFSAGVPTIWTALLQWLRADPSRKFANPPRLVVGGTALPTPINAGFLKEYGVADPPCLGDDGDQPAGVGQCQAAAECRLGRRHASSTMPASRAARCTAIELRVRDADGARDRRMTASPSASWRCAVPGWRSSTSTAPAIRPSPRMAGSAPATW